ncbi:large conductance mechanosensitive channel protein MscL [Sphingomonas oleivorans]|uniref:Large-conductance mechanosensitive channel n=1 Tax=Sphingomonas oleivorans TaxID=1735121 RepID=A0A2T5G0H9_9SPHN|nr:large conductance mechanosensitive channel protein MscL [Sphingomonas oleivorans]PTQ12426.1 large conductance mechanosensitive channel protein MscL [Sphingomonas oleivorans]
MFKEFRAFIARGNVLDLAVAVIVGAAFGRIVTSLTDDMIMPVVGRITGGLDFSNYFLLLGNIPAGYAGSPNSYADLKKAGVPLLGYGQFVTVAVNFLIIAFIIFLLVRAINRLVERQRVAVAEAAPAEPADVVLLREIRDELRKRNDDGTNPAASKLPLEGL